MKCKVISISSLNSKEMPRIVTFQNGEVKPEKAENLQCTALYNSKSGESHLAVSSNKLNYIGKENSNNDLCHTLLAIRNKITNKVRLVPVTTVSLNVHMVNSNSILEKGILSKDATARDLSKQFGSKKAQRKVEQYEKLNLNISNVEEELKNVVKDITIDEDNKSTLDDDKRYRPPMNKDANSVEEVFDINSFLNEEELHSLRKVAEEIVDTGNTTFASLNSFSEECLKLIDKKPENLTRIALFLYVDAIMKFTRTNMQSAKAKKFRISVYSEVVTKKVLDEFSVLANNKRSRPLSCKDKALCYIIALSLMGLNYRINLIPLYQAFGCSFKKAQSFARCLGCRILTGREKGEIVLKIPLVTESETNTSRKRKK